MTDAQANRKIQALLDKADSLLEQSQRVTEQRLLQAYRKALDDVQGQIARVYSRTDTPTIVEMRKFRRLTSIERQIADRIRELTQVSVNITSQAVREEFTRSYQETGNALETGTGLNLRFGQVPRESISYAVSDNLWLDSLKLANAKLISDINREIETVLRTNARQEIVEGLAEGLPYSKVERNIIDRFDVAATRAKTIVRTEMHKSHSKGRLDGIVRGGKAADKLGLKSVKVWRHNDVAAVPRPDHVAYNGTAVPTDRPFHVGGEALEGPGLGTDPANNINCACSAQFEIQGLDELEA